MAHGYGIWSFAWRDMERERARAIRFNDRWHDLVAIHDHINKTFFGPLSDIEQLLTPSESAKLIELMTNATEWIKAINANINHARQNNLTRLATSLKLLALKSINTCKKYGVYSDIETVEYSPQRKMIVVNGNDLYFLG